MIWILAYALGAVLSAFVILVISKIQRWYEVNTFPCMILGAIFWPLVWSLIGPALLLRKAYKHFDDKATLVAERFMK